MNRPTDPETSWEQLAHEMRSNNTIDSLTLESYDEVVDYATELEKYADALEAALESWSEAYVPPTKTDSAPAQQTTDRDSRIIELGNALADAQARLHSIGLLTR